MDFAARITRLPLPVDSARGQSALEATGIADPNGDMAFDHEELPTMNTTLPAGVQVVQLS